ncbi:MAG: HNH endonuclease [Candidatus Woesearchaeota archaeon]
MPVRMSGDLFDKDNLRTLCKECHRMKSNLDSWALKEDSSDSKIDEDNDKESFPEEIIRVKANKKLVSRELPDSFEKDPVKEIKRERKE